MTKVTAVLVPTAAVRSFGEGTQLTLESLRGCVVGFIDNAKPNFRDLVDDLAELLVSKYGVRKTIKLRKRAASVPAPVPRLLAGRVVSVPVPASSRIRLVVTLSACWYKRTMVASCRSTARPWDES